MRRVGWLGLVVAVGACAAAPSPLADGGEADAGPDAGSPDASVDPSAADGGADAGPLCDPRVGLTQPATVCSPSAPCLNPGALQQSGGPITVPISAPSCRTTTSDGHPAFDDGPPRTLVDRDGLTRHACAFRVPTASRRSLRPLVVFFHGLGGSAATVYNATLLRQKAETFVLSGEATRPGFHLLSVQGRNLGFPGGALGDGAGFDFFHRALAQPSSNADIDFVDRLIDERVAEGDVDPSQLYVVGWSSGGYFAQLYAIARATTPTAGGPPRRRRVRVLGRGSLRAA